MELRKVRGFPRSPGRFAFNVLTFRWQAVVPEGSTLAFTVRSDADGVTWADWQPAKQDDQGDGNGWLASGLIVAEGRYAQWAVRLSGQPGAEPLLSQVKLVYIDASPGMPAPPAPYLPLQSAGPDAVIVPQVISRAGWVCQEPYGSPNWLPEYFALAHDRRAPHNRREHLSGWPDHGASHLVRACRRQ